MAYRFSQCGKYTNAEEFCLRVVDRNPALMSSLLHRLRVLMHAYNGTPLVVWSLEPQGANGWFVQISMFSCQTCLRVWVVTYYGIHAQPHWVNLGHRGIPFLWNDVRSVYIDIRTGYRAGRKWNTSNQDHRKKSTREQEVSTLGPPCLVDHSDAYLVICYSATTK